MIPVDDELYELWINNPWRFLIPYEKFICLTLDEIIKYKFIKLNLNINGKI